MTKKEIIAHNRKIRAMNKKNEENYLKICNFLTIFK
jgi:hypothetical protein